MLNYGEKVAKFVGKKHENMDVKVIWSNQV